jgi:succinyldiaminopimelate transaminase
VTSLPSNSWLDLLPKYSLLRNDDRKARLRAAGREIFDFGIGDPLEETPEFIRKALADNIPKVSQYPLSQGSLDFRTACADWCARRLGVKVDPAGQIISSNGSKEAIFHIPHVLLNSGSARRMVAFPDPGFPVYRSSTLLSGGVPYQYTLDPAKNYVFEPDSIPPDILSQIAAVWVSYPHNPTGALLPRAQAELIYRWAVEHDIVLLSDECYVDMYFPGTEKPVSLLEVAADNQYRNLLAFFSLSKRSGMTGYRSGFVAGDNRLISAFVKYRPNVGVGTPEFVQRAAIAAWADDKHVDERNTVFEEKRRIVERFLERNNFTVLPSTATFYVWIKAPAGFASGEDYCAALAEATGIVATPGDALGDSSKHWFRLALVPTARKIEQCVGLWQNAIQSGALSKG